MMMGFFERERSAYVNAEFYIYIISMLVLIICSDWKSQKGARVCACTFVRVCVSARVYLSALDSVKSADSTRSFHY